MTDAKELVERLRGIYRVTVNDGGGPLPGHGGEFTRQFAVPPIQLEAADWIERWAPVEAAARAEAGEWRLKEIALAAYMADGCRSNYFSLDAAKRRLRGATIATERAIDAALGEDKP